MLSQERMPESIGCLSDRAQYAGKSYLQMERNFFAVNVGMRKIIWLIKSKKRHQNIFWRSDFEKASCDCVLGKIW